MTHGYGKEKSSGLSERLSRRRSEIKNSLTNFNSKLHLFISVLLSLHKTELMFFSI